MSQKDLLGAIEAGGTKFVLAVAYAPDTILARHAIPTTTPEETLGAAARWLREQGELSALGIASFGPVELDRSAQNWGHITKTPKPGWSDCDFAGVLSRALGVPVGFDTDVNGAAMAEAAAQGADALAYLTVGTGIGGGLVLDGKPVHGIAHPEMGHFFVRRAADDTDFAGNCPFHGDCLEGLASGPAILARWGKTLSDLPPEHAAHGLVAEYLAQACHTVFASTAAGTIVLGGGVMKAPGLLDRVGNRARALDAGYLPGGERHDIRAPLLGDDAGITGALMLAQGALSSATN